MKYWNELDKNIFFEKLFSEPVKIGKIALFSLQIENDRPSVGLGFDIPEFPDMLPKKWEDKGYNTCRMGIDCHGIQDLKIHNIPVREVFFVTVIKDENLFYFRATNKNSLIEFKAKFISLVDPNVYMNGPNDYFSSTHKLGKIIGEGYSRDGIRYSQQHKARVILDTNGKPKTAYTEL